MTTKIPVELSSTPSIVDNGDATAITIDSSENVGIGTTSPGEKFAVNGDGSYIEITHPTATSFSGMKFSEGGVPQGSLQNIGSTFSTVARRGNFEIFHNTGGNLTLQHGGGNVGIGTTSPSEKLEVDGKALFESSYALYANVLKTNNTSSSTDYFPATFYSGGTLAGYIYVVSSTNTTQFATSSDYRLKENVNYEFDALPRVAQLKPARFNFKSDAETTVDGFLAHEVSDVVPEAVVFEKDGEYMQGLDQSKLVPLLTKAIQEQQAIIEDLQQQINEVKNGN